MSNTFLDDGQLRSIPWQHGPRVRWRDADSRGVLYKLKMRVGAEFFAELPISSAGPAGGWLVEESQPHDIGAGLVEWERVYAYLPPSRVVGESIVYVIQEVYSGDIVEMPIATTANVQHDYFHTLNPRDEIPLLRAWKIAKLGDVIYTLGTPPGDLDTTILAEDSQVRPWRGNIYLRTAPYVSKAILSDA